MDYNLIKEKLYVAVIADILDDMGFKNQVMEANVRPLRDKDVLVGPARTMLSIPEFAEPDPPFQTQIQAVDELDAGDVVVAHCSGITNSAFWGELFSTACLARGVKGVVIDGYIRDTRKLLELDFNVFGTGIRPINSKGRCRVVEYDKPISCGGVQVNPGDIIFAEFDGVVVVPIDIAEEVFEKAFETATKEDDMRAELFDGSTLMDAWKKYRVL